jgi:hypothetical protein
MIMKMIIILTALILMQFLGRAQSSEEVVSFAKDLFPEGLENWDIIINPIGFSSIALKFVLVGKEVVTRYKFVLVAGKAIFTRCKSLLVAGKKVVTRCKSVLVAGKGIFTRCKSVLVADKGIFTRCKSLLVASKGIFTRCKSVLVGGKGIFTRCKSVLVINERYSMNFMIINN